MNSETSIGLEKFNLIKLRLSYPCFNAAIETAKADYPVDFFIIVDRYTKEPDSATIYIYDLSRNPPSLISKPARLKVKEYLLFSWDKVQGNDKERLLRYLRGYLDIDWVKSAYLFSLGDVPESDTAGLQRFLRDDLHIDWAENAEISKSNDGKVIHIVNKDEREKYAEITIYEKEEKALLKISDNKILDLKVKKENGKLNIYESVEITKSDDGKTIRIFKYENSAEIKIEEEEEKATLKICDGRTYNLKVKKENGNIYICVEGLEDIKKRIEKHLSVINEIIRSSCSAEGCKLEQLPESEKWRLKGMISIDKIITAGEELARCLPSLRQLSNGITSDLQNQDENKQIWICGEDEKIFGLLEWAYLRLSNTNSRGEFFGDKFSIIRAPKECKFDNKIINFKINKSRSLLIIDEDSYAKMQYDFLRGIIPKLKEIKIKYNLMRRFKSLLRQKPNKEDFDIIHLAAGRAKINHLKNIVKHEANTANFVFLNICECENVSDKFRLEEEFLSELAKNKGITIPWIRTSFKIHGYFAYHFAEKFYGAFLEGENMTRAVREARESSNRLSNDNLKIQNIWRLAYVMGGNPFVYVIGRDTTPEQNRVVKPEITIQIQNK